VGPKDVHVAQFYENFTGPVLMAICEMGFCEPDAIDAFVRAGNLRWPDGALPINTSGGNLGEAYIHGFELINEAVRQVRGESTCQVADVELSFETQEGVGTTFTLEFSSSGPPVSGASQATLSSTHVLVVGDDTAVLDSACAALIAADARVLVATSAAEAVQALRVHVVEALVCDDAMYPVSASAFLGEARGLFRGPICLLASERQADLQRCYVSVDCVVSKPVGEQDLVNAIAALVT